MAAVDANSGGDSGIPPGGSAAQQPSQSESNPSAGGAQQRLDWSAPARPPSTTRSRAQGRRKLPRSAGGGRYGIVFCMVVRFRDSEIQRISKLI